MSIGETRLRAWSTSQAVIALSSGEAEYYAAIKVQGSPIHGRRLGFGIETSLAYGQCSGETYHWANGVGGTYHFKEYLQDSDKLYNATSKL